MLMRLVFTDSAAGERCESRLLVLLVFGSETWWCSGKEVKRVSGGSDDADSSWGEPSGVRASVDEDVKERGAEGGQVKCNAATGTQRRNL